MDCPHLADRRRSVFITNLSVLHHTGLKLMLPRWQQAEREAARFHSTLLILDRKNKDLDDYNESE